MTLRKDTWIILSFLAFIIASRFAIFYLFSIKPDMQYLLGHWQHLDLGQLNYDLINSILNLHSQPPLWNIILGVASNICDGCQRCTLRLIHLFNISLTLASSIVLYRMLLLFGQPRSLSVIAVIGFSLLPSTVFYENYAFYPHFSMFLALCAVFFLVMHFQTERLSYLVVALACLALLSWLLGLFHPIIMIVVGLAVLIMSPSRAKPKTMVAMVIFAVFVAAPATKNYIYFDFFGNSSWLGLNLSQVAPRAPDHCSFGAFHDTVKDIEHSGTALNQLSIIEYSKHCQEEAVDAILREPRAYAIGRLRAAFNSTRRTPSDYFFPPVGFDSYPRISGIYGFRTGVGTMDPKGIISRGVFFVNVFLLGFAIALPFIIKGQLASLRKALSIGSILILTVLIVGHAANGGEQERMRYTINALVFLGAIILLFDSLLPRLKKRVNKAAARKGALQ